MSRRRYITTDISVDKNVKHLAMEAGDFAALLYTWMIPHADDHAILTGDPEELLDIVAPGRRDKAPEDVAAALDAMEGLGLIERAGGKVGFPIDSFYRYQAYVKASQRRTLPLSGWLQNQRQLAETSGKRQTPQKVAENSVPIPVPVPITDPSGRGSRPAALGDGASGAPETPPTDQQIIGGLIEYAQEAVGRTLSRNDCTIIGHAYHEFGSGPLTEAIASAKATLDRGGAVGAIGPYVLKAARNIRDGRAANAHAPPQRASPAATLSPQAQRAARIVEEVPDAPPF